MAGGSPATSNEGLLKRTLHRVGDAVVHSAWTLGLVIGAHLQEASKLPPRSKTDALDRCIAISSWTISLGVSAWVGWLLKDSLLPIVIAALSQNPKLQFVLDNVVVDRISFLLFWGMTFAALRFLRLAKSPSTAVQLSITIVFGMIAAGLGYFLLRRTGFALAIAATLIFMELFLVYRFSALLMKFYGDAKREMERKLSGSGDDWKGVLSLLDSIPFPINLIVFVLGFFLFAIAFVGGYVSMVVGWLKYGGYILLLPLVTFVMLSTVFLISNVFSLSASLFVLVAAWLAPIGAARLGLRHGRLNAALANFDSSIANPNGVR